MKKKLLLGVMALALLLTGCSQPATSPTPTRVAPEPTATVEPTATAQSPIARPTIEPIPTEELPAEPAVTFEPAPCPFELPPGQVEGETVECGYLVVPEDRADPDTDTIRLAVAIFHPPGGATEPDPIIYLVGGPGASILELLYLSFDKAFAPVFVTNRDLILFDQRGVGLSEPALDCPDASELGLELLDYELDGEQLTDEEIDNLFGEAFMACEQDLSAIADLAAYNTVASAADVNDLRIALGYDQVNLWGGSYGTRLALGVMRDYPEGLRSVVLDSVYPPDVNMYLESPASLNRSLNLLFEACAADEACDAAFPHLRQLFFDTVERLDADAVDTVITNPLTGESYDALLTGDGLFGLVFQLLYETEVLPGLPQLVYDASQGNFDTINRIRGALLAQSTISSPGMMFSVQCNEELAFSSLEEFEAVLADYPELAGFFEDSMLGYPAFHVCTYWGSGQAAAIENEPVSSDVPTLVMQGEYDPITPPDWGRNAAETLENGHFFEYPGVGHGASVVAGCPCEMLIAFLNDPAHAPDDSCIAEMGGLSFVVPAESEPIIELEPFTNKEMGISGIAPVGWTESAPGVFTRGSSGLDVAALVVQAAPVSAQDLLTRLTGQLGLDEMPPSVGERESNGLTWTLYAVEVQGVSVDIALSESEGSALIVLLQSTPDERDALYEAVFLPIVDALTPLE